MRTMPGGLRLCVLAAAAGLACEAWAQPTAVRAWYAQGQVFVVWRFPAAPVNPTDTVEIYSSPAAQGSTAGMTREGRLFFTEYTGARLRALSPGATLTVPAAGGGTYRLANDEGVFAFTPRAAGNRFFAVVDTGSTAVGAGNSAGAALGYDPVNDPVRPHRQFAGFTAGGQPYTAYVVWADGRVDPEDRRPDVPVLASREKNGVPHVFTITAPAGGLPPGPVPAVFALHGGGGEYQLFRPGVAARANVSLGMTGGVVVTPDDSFYANIEGGLERMNTSWFGYVSDVDPFTSAPRVPPAGTSVVVNYTQRRVHWVLDWLLSPRSPVVIDARRVSMVGHSGGGRGTSHLTRLTPERFAAAVCYTPAFGVEPGSVGRENFLRGSNEQNLATNLSVGGVALGVTDVFNPLTRLSETSRDFCPTWVYVGKRDTVSAAAWDPEMRAIMDSLNDSRKGFVVVWDEREHGVEMWNTEDPAPGPDVAQWIVPPTPPGGGKTRRPAAQELAETYDAALSFPALFNSDADPVLAGRQPDPGPGDPNLGDAWGTWTGHAAWEHATIVDEPGRWAATVYLTGLSATPVDNAPWASITADMTPRKTASFNPAAGTAVRWYAVGLPGGTLERSGESVAESDGVVQVTGLVVPRDPRRLRVTLCAGSVGAAPVVTGPAGVVSCPGGSAVFTVAASGAGPFDYRWQIETPPVGSGSWSDLADGPVRGGAATASGSRTATLTIAGADGQAAGRYRCVVSSATTCGEATSGPALLTLCAADLNCDGLVDFNDLLEYLNQYNASDPRADLNGDGVIDFNDLLEYVNLYNAGC